MSEKKNNIVQTIAIFIIFVAMVAVLIMLMNVGKTSASATSFFVDGTVEGDEVDVSSKIPGKVKFLNVQEGDFVKKGQILAQIDSQELNAKKDQAEAGVKAAEILKKQGTIALALEKDQSKTRIEQAQAAVSAYEAGIAMANQKLTALRKGARDQEKSQAKAAVDATKSAYETAEKTYARIKSLADQGVIAEQKADEVAMQLQAAKSAYDAAQAKYSLALEGPRKEEIRAAEDQVKELEAKLFAAKSALTMAQAAKMTISIKEKDVQAAQQKIDAGKGTLNEVQAYLNDTVIKAPISGRVRNVMLKQGELAAAGYAILTITSNEKCRIDLYVDENQCSTIKLGDVLQVEILALSKKIPAKIIKIMPTADFAVKKATNEKNSYDVRALQIRLQPQGSVEDLLPGMTARVKIGEEKANKL